MFRTSTLLILTAAVALAGPGCGPDSDDSSPDDVGVDTPDDVRSDADPAPPAIEFVEMTIDGDATLATDLVFLPGGDEFLLVSRPGDVFHYALVEGGAELLGSFQLSGFFSDFDCGLLAVAIDPDFETNGLAYFGGCTALTGNAIFRATFDSADYAGIDATMVEIITVEDPAASAPWHNIGSMGFDPDGYLWALFGEKNERDNGQDPTNNLGTMLRIDPSREDGVGGYAIPDDNPFVGVDGFNDEIFAWGLRSPWRGSMDSSGRWWIGDVGADAIEELNLLIEPGTNFGWGDHEGPCASNCDGVTDPVLTYDHEDNAHPYILDDEDVVPTPVRSVWVGPVYEDRGNDRYEGALTDRVLFGDFCLGFVRAAGADGDGTIIEDRHIGHLSQITGAGQGGDGYLYFTTFGSCEARGIGDDDGAVVRLYRAEIAE